PAVPLPPDTGRECSRRVDAVPPSRLRRRSSRRASALAVWPPSTFSETARFPCARSRGFPSAAGLPHRAPLTAALGPRPPLPASLRLQRTKRQRENLSLVCPVVARLASVAVTSRPPSPCGRRAP